MSVILVFLLVMAGIAVWWLSHQRLMAKPWLEQGVLDTFGGSVEPANTDRQDRARRFSGCRRLPVRALHKRLFHAHGAVGLAASAHAAPALAQHGLLVLSSVALQCALVAARRGQLDTVRLGLAAAGLTAIGFLIGQLMAWRALSADGYLLSGNPANSFFYLITGMHGLHILGGLVGLARTSVKAWNGAPMERVRLGVDLCAMYWHFLLLVWLGLFVLLAGWAAQFVDICRQLLS